MLTAFSSWSKSPQHKAIGESHLMGSHHTYSHHCFSQEGRLIQSSLVLLEYASQFRRHQNKSGVEMLFLSLSRIFKGALYRYRSAEQHDIFVGWKQTVGHVFRQSSSQHRLLALAVKAKTCISTFAYLVLLQRAKCHQGQQYNKITDRECTLNTWRASLTLIYLNTISAVFQILEE